MLQYLKEADLERFGFKKTVEVTTETDENGKRTKKTTIYFLVTDDCSRVMFWESVLEQRLPEELRSSKRTSTIVKEIRSRIDDRKTKGCTVGLEIHLHPGSSDGQSKRGIATSSAGHWWCRYASIKYA